MERFWQKVEKTETCWLWTGAIDNHGYGRFRLNRKTIYAHRFSFEAHHGNIETGTMLDHLCRNRRCVNPLHLEQVTARTNVLRGVSPAAAAAARTECPNGHQYDVENTYRRRNGQRVCRACHREEMRRSRA